LYTEILNARDFYDFMMRLFFLSREIILKRQNVQDQELCILKNEEVFLFI
jgi:hypothetical protein